MDAHHHGTQLCQQRRKSRRALLEVRDQDKVQGDVQHAADEGDKKQLLLLPAGQQNAGIIQPAKQTDQQSKAQDLQRLHRIQIAFSGNKEHHFPAEQDQPDDRRGHHDHKGAENIVEQLVELFFRADAGVMGQTRNGNDQHRRKKVLHDAVDFSRHSIDADVVIAAQNAEDRRVRADVQRRRQRGGKDDHNGLEMGLPVDLPCKVDGTIPPGAEIVEDIGAHRCKDRDPRIDAVIALIFHEQEECGEGKDLKDHAAHRDVGILLKDREDPFGADGREEDLQAHDEEQVRITPQFGRTKHGHKQG